MAYDNLGESVYKLSIQSSPMKAAKKKNEFLLRRRRA